MKELALFTLAMLGMTLIVGIVVVFYVLIDTIKESQYNKSLMSLSACLAFIELLLLTFAVGLYQAIQCVCVS